MPIVVLALLPTGAFAKGKIFINSYLATDYAVITANYGSTDRFRVKIFDETGTELYTSSRMNGSSFQKLFDLTAFQDGIYTIELTGRKDVVSESFIVKDHKLVKPDNSEIKSEILKAFFRITDEKLYVSHLNSEKAVLSIRINDASGIELYNSELPSKSTYSGMFDLTNLPAGEYQVSLISGNKEYNYAFNK